MIGDALGEVLQKTSILHKEKDEELKVKLTIRKVVLERKLHDFMILLLKCIYYRKNLPKNFKKRFYQMH